MDLALPPILFLGAGNMGNAMIEGLLRTRPDAAIRVCDPVAQARDRQAARGLTTSALVEELLDGVGILVLAVKPQTLPDLISTLRHQIGRQHLLVSILAGVPLGRLEDSLDCRVVRAMPNTPLAVGQGMVALAGGSRCTAQDLAMATCLFAGSAQVMELPESQMDAFTALCGSGPAYVFRFAESLLEAAVTLGFSPDQACILVSQTLAGSVTYLQSQPGLPAARLRQQVTSPGGTTAAALAVLEQGGWVPLLVRALQAARDRGQELGRLAAGGR